MQPIKVKSLQVDKLVFGQLEDNAYVKSQKTANITYESDARKLLIQTPSFLTETYGIPREGPFYANAKSRAFYKLPFCHEKKQFPEEIDYAEIEDMYSKFLEIDAFVGSRSFRVKLLGEKLADKYEYQPLVRGFQNPEGEEEEEVREEGKYFRPPYAKIKLDLAYETEVPRFKLYENVGGKRQEVVLKTFDDALKYMRFMTKHRMLVLFHKLYAMKTSSGTEKRKYGIVLKAHAVECTNKQQPRDIRNLIDCFSDDDEDDL